MCGISGIFNQQGKPVREDLLRQMTARLAHRGPDGEGTYCNEYIGLGHRRLAIIDLTQAAHQPMLSPDNRYALTFNGEIYNFRELRCELQQLGYRFKSTGDAEVVLYAYAAWGENAVSRFNGMFALAIWDSQEKTLFLSRDRYGIKPLYYTFQDDIFLFASEQKALFAHPSVKRQINVESLIEYFTFQNIFTENTLQQGVMLFPAGCYGKLFYGKRQQNIEVNVYWDFHFNEPEVHDSEVACAQEVTSLFSQAVNRQLVSDAPVGSYLSGGIDSGSITAVAAKANPYMKTFTCGFDLRSASGLELGFDEREKAEYMSYLFKTEHYEMVLKAGDMERILPQLVYHLEEPRVGQSYPNFYTARLASKFVKVVLSGTGGDEIFAGYPWRYFRMQPPHRFNEYLKRYYQYWQRMLTETEIEAVFAPIWTSVKHVSTYDIFCGVFTSHPNELKRQEDYINHSLYFEAKTFLQGLLLVEDKLSMAHGLETRLPFLDNDLVDFSMKIPVAYKLREMNTLHPVNENDAGLKIAKYYEAHHDGKLILRKVAGQYIPQEITQAKKQGFSAPDASWFKGDSIDYLRRVLLNNKAKIYQFMDPIAVEKLIKEHLEGKKNRRLFIWSLLSFEQYLTNY